MAVFPAAFCLLLHFNLIFGYAILGDEENEIVWPTEYRFLGEKLDFETTLKTPFEIWYSAELNRSRIDYYGGTNRKYFYGDDGYELTLFPTSEVDMSSTLTCAVEWTGEEQLDFLPDVSTLSFTGQTMNLFDKVVDVWTGTEILEVDMVKLQTLYVFKTDTGYDIPVQNIVKKYYIQQGEIASYSVTNYYNFVASVTKEDLTSPEEFCGDYARRGEDFKTDMKLLHPDLPRDVDIGFESYANHHNKQYQQNEKIKRKAIFEKNWRMVHEHNRQKLGYKLQLNAFSDRTPEELQHLTGTFISKRSASDVQEFPHTLEEIDDLVKELPENFDLRIEGVVTPVKILPQSMKKLYTEICTKSKIMVAVYDVSDIGSGGQSHLRLANYAREIIVYNNSIFGVDQAACGSCWAFATTAAVEGAVARANGDRLLDLSEQSLVDCAWTDDNMGCHGGTLDGALRYVYDNGIPTEREYGVYTASDGYCDILNMTTTYNIKGFAKVTPRNPNALKVALYKYGPATIAIHAGLKMKHYASGLFYDFDCEDTHPNHGVTVIGYGKREGEDYWIVKNSWGESWGEDGYILMSARDNNCFVLDSPYYAIV